jgi:hypothetical protein
MPVHADTRQHPLNEGELVGFRSDRLPLQLALRLRRSEQGAASTMGVGPFFLPELPAVLPPSAGLEV